MLGNLLRSVAYGIGDLSQKLSRRVNVLRSGDILIEDFIARQLLQNPKYQDAKRLNRHEYQVFSQNGEDGIVHEIFRRIGTTNRRFVEFGVGDGLENNSTALLIEGWSGAWIEGSAEQVASIRKTHAEPLASGQLRMLEAFVRADTIQDLFAELDVPEEPDLLSIDIDGNDYWVWQAITRYRPRVVILEYNASYGPHLSWVMRYNPGHTWPGTNYFGASLKAFERLGRKKGYSLVGCNFVGVNAFFVRDDLVGDRFCAPFDSDTHWEPARYYLTLRRGFAKQFGPFESVD